MIAKTELFIVNSFGELIAITIHSHKVMAKTKRNW